MAESDTHYNGMYDTGGSDGESAIRRPFPGEGGSGDANVPVVPLPNPGEGGPILPVPDTGSDENGGSGTGGGNGSSGNGGGTGSGGNGGSGNGGSGDANVPVIPLPNPGEGGPVYPGDGWDEGSGNGQHGGSGRPNGGQNSRPNDGHHSKPGSGQHSRPNGGQGSGGSGNGWNGGGSGNGGSSGNNGSFGGCFGNCGGWIPPIPGILPSSYGQVRFLNASTNSFMVNISLDNMAFTINSYFGTLSDYDYVTDGFHTVTIRHATGPRSILLQQNFPFMAGQKVTMVLTDSASGGLELIRVIDTGCTNMPEGSGCYRFANMSYSGSVYDLLLYNGETVFGNVAYQTATSYKQAIAGTYPFYVANSNTWSYIRELPILVLGAVATGAGVRSPLLSFSATLEAGKHYTSYLIGNTWSDNSLQVLTTED